ncbi:hypothetical protein SLEP1_g19751 [Rubroshorea leprosula]|uniref:non-specific serine/threonine protein kinase n=2 Tax=Rubroshorea leprosula TaxID=152421 RepID=A0AAV5J3S6_9ROSI|nr:hypothetical protein SLEP1_g19751 [Rubroshorea leprosula]
MVIAFGSFFLFSVSSLAVISFALSDNHGEFIYNGFNGASLHLAGIANIQPHGLLQLTNTSNRQIGRAFFQFPIEFNTSYSFSTSFVFAFVRKSQDYFGHGMAFVISPSTDFSHAVASEYLGLFNISNDGASANHVLAVEFDCVLSPEFKDIDNNHVGIDVNNLTSIESTSVSFYSNGERKNRRLELMSGEPIRAWIDYVEDEKLLNVTVAPVRCPKPNYPLLSKSIDLSKILLDTMYVGFSAATGAVASNHYVLGWSFNRSGEAESLKIAELPHLPKEKIAQIGIKELVLYKVIMLLIVLIFLGTICGAAYLFWRNKYGEVREEWEKEFGPQRFSYKTLYKATKGFKDKDLLGEGGFGKVYRGTLQSSNEEIAVKRVRHKHDSGEGMKQFVSEIVSMRRLRHRNLVRLLGYSRRKGELLLVYDYMPQGSLDKFLFTDEKPSLNWPQRFQILRGVASALLYLHEEWEQVVLHRDIKASNILLDSELNGKIADFGLARLHDRGSSSKTTLLVGTLGYMAPELTRTGKANMSTDVFAFGALLLEVACGRKPIEPQGLPEEVSLVGWVRTCWARGDILHASDPRLGGAYVVEEMELVLKLGLLCSHPDPEIRPTMRQVLQYLDGNANLPDTITPRNVASNNANSLAFLLHTAEISISTANFVESGQLTLSPTSWSSSESILYRGR